MLFRSPTIWFHILRGVIGLAFAAVALQYAPIWGWWVVLPAAVALICFGGCPMCWTVGLVDTVLRRKSASCATCGR